MLGGLRDPHHMFQWYTNGNYFECWFCRDKVTHFLRVFKGIPKDDGSLKIFGVCDNHVESLRPRVPVEEDDWRCEEVSLEDISVYEIMYI